MVSFFFPSNKISFHVKHTFWYTNWRIIQRPQKQEPKQQAAKTHTGVTYDHNTTQPIKAKKLETPTKNNKLKLTTQSIEQSKARNLLNSTKQWSGSIDAALGQPYDTLHL